MPSLALLRVFFALLLAGYPVTMRLFEVSAYTRLCSEGEPWFGRTASGEVARVGMAALPASYPFGTLVYLDGGADSGSGLGSGVRRWRVEDRGAEITRLQDGRDRMDLCLVGLTASDSSDELAARKWGRQDRWAVVVWPTAD